jgi:hypothetical protein
MTDFMNGVIQPIGAGEKQARGEQEAHFRGAARLEVVPREEQVHGAKNCQRPPTEGSEGECEAGADGQSSQQR